MGARVAAKHPTVHTRAKVNYCFGCWKLRTPPNLTINERNIHTNREGEGKSDYEPERELIYDVDLPPCGHDCSSRVAVMHNNSSGVCIPIFSSIPNNTMKS